MGRKKKHDKNAISRQQSSKSSDSGSYGRRTRSKSRDRRSSRSRSRGRRSSRSRSRGRRSSRSRSRERHSSRSRSRRRRVSRSVSRCRRYSRSGSGDRRSPGKHGSRGNGRRRTREPSQSYGRRSRDRSRSRSSEKTGRNKHGKRSWRYGHSKRSRTSQEKTKDTMKEIEVMKSRMRSALESAQLDNAADGRGLVNDSHSIMDLTVTEAVARHRDIERIEEEEGLHQSTFISSSGGAGGRVKKEYATDRTAIVAKKEDEHDKAMFGPKWRDAEKGCSNEENEIDVEVAKEIDNARFSENVAVREKRWLKIYRETRAKLLCQ